MWSFLLEDVWSRWIFPKWILSIVLSALLADPHEPLAKATLLQKYRKAAFLLTMATASRVWEILALDSSSLTHANYWALNYHQITSWIPQSINYYTLGPHITPPCLSANCRPFGLSLSLSYAGSQVIHSGYRPNRRHRKRLFISCKTHSDKDINAATVSSSRFYCHTWFLFSSGDQSISQELCFMHICVSRTSYISIQLPIGKSQHIHQLLSLWCTTRLSGSWNYPYHLSIVFILLWMSLPEVMS